MDRNPQQLTNHLARLTLAAFLLTFVIARILVIMIMAHRLPPELFFHVKGTHVHHLNYGIFLLSAVGGFLIFARPRGPELSAAAAVYGVGLGLTFDEFGMWLHLGGMYWQRASYDAIIVIAAGLALIAYGSTLRRWHPRHIFFVLVFLGLTAWLAVMSVRHLEWKYGSAVTELEEQGPS